MKRHLLKSAFLAILVFGSIAPEPHSLAKASLPHASQKNRVLTFADRIAYQRAIEEVYWRHRIWPKENPGPKPSLDEVMSPVQIEKKVEDYLRDSQLLTDQRQRPITPGELQAEMDRMASHTKQPDVLREVFAALGNDPFVIAECVARPILVGRLIESGIRDSEATRKPIDPTPQSETNDVTNDVTYKLQEISASPGCPDGTWTATSATNPPFGRISHTTIWTGTEMIVWGGTNYDVSVGNTGGRYSPSTDSWASVSTANSPSGRASHSAVWTGTGMIIWGGSASGGVVNTGGRYNPADDSWTSSSTNGAPTARLSHRAVWTGNEMIVWGGKGNAAFTDTNTGGRYDPNADSWIATSLTNAPDARTYHTAVWTGNEMIIWGGTANNFALNTGGRYNPRTNTWVPTSTANAPQGRYIHTAIWTGNEMIVWGGAYILPPPTELNTGGRYNPVTDSWTATSTVGPAPHSNHSAVWTGNEMIIWGGYENVNSGGVYKPSTDSWRATATMNVPQGRGSHTAVWTGNDMIIWGGYYYSGDYVFPTSGGRYCAQPTVPIVQSVVSRKAHGGAGIFDVSLPLSGTSGIECRRGGATNDYTILVTFLANVSINSSPAASVVSGTATIGTGGFSNGGNVVVSSNVVTIPLTNVANAQTIGVTLHSVNGSTDVTIPMSILVGDANGNGSVNASDVGVAKSWIGQEADATNFRSDVNANGTINATDVSLTKSAIGTALP